ncbi:MAG TPA: hypothetical protein VKH63_21765, partial [Candidatus Acidoferrum sp.]|nr:hypothetical protein [Candidatus Acidoferrum sp.]
PRFASNNDFLAFTRLRKGVLPTPDSGPIIGDLYCRKTLTLTFLYFLLFFYLSNSAHFFL